jgi:hypothetical protein
MARIAALLIALCLAAPAGAAGFPDPPGWTPAGKVMTFDTQGLFKAINGAAELYIAYGFRELRVRDFEHDGMRIALNVFDMGESLNAYGVYRRERSSKARPIRAGIEAASAPPFQCQLVKGPYYVKVDAHKGKLTLEVCSRIVERVAEALPGSDELPAPFALLPGEHRVAGSIGYARKDYLGLGELANCVHASYRPASGQEYLIFVMVAADPDATWKLLGAKWKSVEAASREVLIREVPYRGEVIVARTEDGVVGVVSAGDEPLPREFLLKVLPSGSLEKERAE